MLIQIGVIMALQLAPITDFYIFRHGESTSNVQQVLSGGGDTAASLTEKGQDQAVKLGQKIAEEGIQLEVIYSSDLQRAEETAIKVASYLNSSPEIILAPQLREILDGKYELLPRTVRNGPAAELLATEMAKFQTINIPQEIAEGRLDRFHFWKIHPIQGNVSDDQSPAKRMETYFTEGDGVPETTHEFYLRLREELIRIAKESIANGHQTVGISTHGAALSTLIDADKHREGSLFLPPFYHTEEVKVDNQQVMPGPTKLTNCGLVHFRYHHDTQRIEFHRIVYNPVAH
jgi:broad specificity phosphatase PhoE